MRRSTVDFPQPDGPRIAMNSPLSGRSGTENVTSRMTVTFPKRLVTFRKSTTFAYCGDAAAPGAPAASVFDDTMGEHAALEPVEQPIDSVREQAGDDEDQDDVP